MRNNNKTETTEDTLQIYKAEDQHRAAVGKSESAESSPSVEHDDVQYREEREHIVRAFGKASIAAAKALAEINTYCDGRLWNQQFKTFAHYCRVTWGYANSHCARLLEAGSFVADLERKISPIGEKIPQSEWQIRALFDVVPREHRVACWLHIVSDKSPAKLTGPMVRDAALRFLQENGFASRTPAKTQPTDQTRALSTAEKLRSLLRKLPKPGRFEQPIKVIIDLIMNDAGGVKVTVAKPRRWPDSKAPVMDVLADGSVVAVRQQPESDSKSSCAA